MESGLKLTIHCSDTANGKPADIEAIRRDHKRFGFKDIGYHYLIQPSGVIIKGRDEGVTGAHVKDHNAGNLGVCLIGRDKFGLEQFQSLKRLFFDLSDRLSLEIQNVYCHYEFDTAQRQRKTCPNIRAANIALFLSGHDTRCLRSWIL